MWGMECSHTGNMITLRHDKPIVRFRVIGDTPLDKQKTFDNFAVFHPQQALPLTTPPPLKPLPEIDEEDETSLKPLEEQFCWLFSHYSKDGRQKRGKANAGRLTLQEVGRFLRTFMGPLSNLQVSAIVTSANGSAGSYLGFADFVTLCCAHLPIVPCLEYLEDYLEAEQNGAGYITGQAAAQLLEKCNFRNAARQIRRERPEYVTYTQFVHLISISARMLCASGVSK